jgi:HEAT repeat protein
MDILTFKRKFWFSSIAVILWALMLGLLAGCETTGSPSRSANGFDPEQAQEARATTIKWLECEECVDGELEAVVRLGQDIVPSLEAVLHEGLSPAGRKFLESELEKRYDRMMARAEENPRTRPAGTREQFLEQYMGNFEAMYRIRAAIALGEIGGSKANQALQEASQTEHRRDVERAIREALAKLN